MRRFERCEVSEKASIGVNVDLGIGAIIYDNVEIGDYSHIGPYCIIGSPTHSLGKLNNVHQNTQTKIGRNSIIQSHTSINENVFIGDNVSIGEFSIIHSGVTIGNNVVIENNTTLKNNVSIFDDSFIGANSILGEFSSGFYTDRINYVNKETIIEKKALIRSGAIIYNEVRIGNNFQSGHRITIREGTAVGNNSSIGTLCDLQGKLQIGNFVRIHSNVHVGQKSIIKDFVWIYPYVVLTNDPYPPMGELIGVTVNEYAQIATGAIIMPGINIGVNALVGAHALVKKDVEDERVVVGVPAKDICSVREIRNKNGEQIYPWKEYLKDFRGYPWQNKTLL